MTDRMPKPVGNRQNYATFHVETWISNNQSILDELLRDLANCPSCQPSDLKAWVSSRLPEAGSELRFHYRRVSRQGRAAEGMFDMLVDLASFALDLVDWPDLLRFYTEKADEIRRKTLENLGTPHPGP